MRISKLILDYCPETEEQKMIIIYYAQSPLRNSIISIKESFFCDEIDNCSYKEKCPIYISQPDTEQTI